MNETNKQTFNKLSSNLKKKKKKSFGSQLSRIKNSKKDRLFVEVKKNGNNLNDLDLEPVKQKVDS